MMVPGSAAGGRQLTFMEPAASLRALETVFADRARLLPARRDVASHGTEGRRQLR